MNRILEVCLIAATLVASSTPHSIAQSLPMTRGVSVQLPVANSAALQPDADKEDAKVVTVTESGDIDFGIDPIPLSDLAQKIQSTPFIRGQKLYIKADARTPYGKVLQIVEATQTSGIAPQVLLTTRDRSPQPGTMVSPRGLEIMVGSALPAGQVATVVQLLNSGPQRRSLTINKDEIPTPDVESTLRRHFQKGDEKIVLLKADATLPFGDVVQVIGACHSAGAQIFLATPTL